MASLLQAEKELFEKFWKGTFKAVATPRPESVIIASIVNKLETSVCVAAKPHEAPSEREEQEVKETGRKRHRKHKAHKRHRRHRSHSVSVDSDFSPQPAPKRRKKKKKSERKRRRERRRFSSPSPIRKKKKKKKSSKKRKHHSSASKKRRHSSSGTRRKRKEDRKHKKRCHGASHHRRRSRRAESSDWRSSSTESRAADHSKSGFQSSARYRSGAHGGLEWCSALKLASKIHSECSVEHSRPGLETTLVQNKGRADYDSGNDTSSPPSSKIPGRRNVPCHETPEKLKFVDSSSDSGNSLSYESLSKAERGEGHVHSTVFKKIKSEESSSCAGFVSHRPTSSEKHEYRSETRSRSRSRSCKSSRHWGRDSRSRSSSSGRRSYSRSSSYSWDSRRGSVCSASSRQSGKYSRYTPDRIRGKRRSSSSRKHSRRRYSSPMRKRRRDSPSHLEARRITSARKRPIPYHRPSPSSSSSRSSSLSPWSLFSLTRSQSRSPIRSRSRSRSRSSCRSYSRSSSISSVDSGRSRSSRYS
ncbi:serine/arginine repetitive matrix protein 4 isoform X2 [Trichomycterus rosablanca]|uniref:serine/arginine repetitive matrix protein 4 isoform X2 n=1 Tax=Trichomycterus rosablanca TaxID=2290929 RepID=UPI002F35E11F